MKVQNLTKLHDSRSVAGISNITFELKLPQCLAIIGPSGSGKTTLLNCLAGNIPYEKGAIEIVKKIAYVPQHDSLDEKLNLFENLAKEILSIEDEEKRANQVRSTLSLLELTNEREHLPIQLSGGQKQRAIIGKALVKNPELLLLDEPFGHLDEHLRRELMSELFTLFKSQDISVIWVTHQNNEALAFSDQIMVLNFGKIQQMGTPEQVYNEPKNLFVAQFLGNANAVAGKLVKELDHSLIVNLLGQEMTIPRPENFHSTPHGDILLIIRPEHITIGEGFRGKVLSSQFYGPYHLVEIAIKDSVIQAYLGAQVPESKLEIHFSHIYCLSEV